MSPVRGVAVTEQRKQALFTCLVALLPISMIFQVVNLDFRASTYPIALSGALLALLATIAVLQVMRQAPSMDDIISRNAALRVMSRNIFEAEGTLFDQLRAFTLIPVFLGLVFVLGFPIAAVALINGFILLHDRSKYLIRSLSRRPC